MQSANKLLCVLHLCVQALYFFHQLYKGLSLLDVLCLDLQPGSGTHRVFCSDSHGAAIDAHALQEGSSCI